jgi:hypothetical protein
MKATHHNTDVLEHIKALLDSPGKAKILMSPSLSRNLALPYFFV